LQLVKKFPAFLWNPKVHYRTHMRPPPVPVLGQPNPVHIPTSHLLEMHPNIIHSSTPRSPQWSLSVQFDDGLHTGPKHVVIYYILLLIVILLCSWLYVYIDIYTLQLCIIQEILPIVPNPDVHCRIHNSPPPFPRLL